MRIMTNSVRLVYNLLALFDCLHAIVGIYYVCLYVAGSSPASRMEFLFEVEHGKSWYQYDTPVQKQLMQCVSGG